MQASAHKERDKNGRRMSTDRRHEDLRCDAERRDEIGRRQNMIANIEPENRSNDERRTDQRRQENRRKTIRRSEPDRRED